MKKDQSKLSSNSLELRGSFKTFTQLKLQSTIQNKIQKNMSLSKKSSESLVKIKKSLIQQNSNLKQQKIIKPTQHVVQNSYSFVEKQKALKQQLDQSNNEQDYNSLQSNIQNSIKIANRIAQIDFMLSYFNDVLDDYKQKEEVVQYVSEMIKNENTSDEKIEENLQKWLQLAVPQNHHIKSKNDAQSPLQTSRVPLTQRQEPQSPNDFQCHIFSQPHSRSSTPSQINQMEKANKLKGSNTQRAVLSKKEVKKTDQKKLQGKQQAYKQINPLQNIQKQSQKKIITTNSQNSQR